MRSTIEPSEWFLKNWKYQLLERIWSNWNSHMCWYVIKYNHSAKLLGSLYQTYISKL